MRPTNTDSRLFRSKRYAWLTCLVLAGSLLTSANADKLPRILTDLPVTHSLVSMVTGDKGTPVLLIKGSASPHDYSLRPSEAIQLDSADWLFWTSRELTPWLSRAIEKNRRSIPNLELMDAPQTLRLTYRKDNAFDDGHNHGSHDHGAKTNADNNLSVPVDPHGWLDPVNAIYWLNVIAEQLGALDKANKSVYQSNADVAIAQLEKLMLGIDEQLAPLSGLSFFVFHDSYHYFEQRFDIHAQAAIALGDAQLPGIRRMNTLKSQLREHEDACVFTEPQFSERIVSSLIRGLPVSTGSLDPLGTSLQPGPDLYVSLLQNITDELVACLTPDTKTQ